MEAVSQAFGTSFTYVFDGTEITLKAPTFADFAFMESKMIEAEPPLEEQAAAIAKLASSDVNWSKEVCKELYQEALDRRRKVKTDDLIEYCFVDVVGHAELVFRLMVTQQPKGWMEISKEAIINATANALLNEDERAMDTIARMAEASGVSDPVNPT